MGSPEVGTLGRLMWAQTALSHLAPFHQAPAFARGVLLCTEGAIGSPGLTVGGNMTPRTTALAKCVWPTLLIGVNLVAPPGEPNPTPAEAAEDRLAQNCGHHRRTAAPCLLEPGPDLSPAQPSDVCGDVNPCVFRLEFLSELP